MSDELTTRQAAKRAGVTAAYIRYLLIHKKVKGRKLDGWQWLVDGESLGQWMKQRKER